MSKHRIVCIVVLLLSAISVNAAELPQISGKVTDKADNSPLVGAAIRLDNLWAITDSNGEFRIKDVQKGKYSLKVSILGYVDYEQEMTVSSDIEGLQISLELSSLALEGVTVTAKRPKDGSGTSHNIGRDALNHLQLSNMSDMSALLPGGKTINPDLTSANEFAIRNGGMKQGNSSFSTAVEVDGVRLGNNAGFGELAGIDTRNIAVDNVESVEVISGVPSAEYGDLGSGIVKVHTKTGRTPLNVTFSVNPRTWQTSLAKGIGLGEDNGILNVSAEWTNATKKLTSPYESYTRRGITLKYSNTFSNILRFEAGMSGNLGGMNSKDDPDAYSGEYSKANDNVLRGNVAMTWLINRSWITNLKFDASVNYNDNKSLYHQYNSSASVQPAVHSEKEGYFLASQLPTTYFSDQVIDSKELDFSASLKYSWDKRWGECKNHLKAGVQWKANGNAGQGEYYEEPSLAANGYRPRPYSEYPYMHNLSAYLEEDITFPFGLQLTAGIRMENVFVKGSQYKDVTSFTPRFNAKWQICKAIAVRGGWGISEKLPSFYILYPKQEYRDILTFGLSHGQSASYAYYTQPFSMLYNPDLKWQSTRNSEIGIDIESGDFTFSLVGFYNITQNPYNLRYGYSPLSYNISDKPAGFVASDNPVISVDSKTGLVTVDGTPMPVKVTDQTFVRNVYQSNGSPVKRTGAELTVDFPEIRPIRTQLRLDAAYTYSMYDDRSEACYYNNGWSHTSEANKSYQYVGIYTNGGSGTLMISGKESHNLDANLTAITRIPAAKLVITCRLEMSLLDRFINLPAGGKDVLYPVSYITVDGKVHEFTEAQKTDPEFSNLVIYPSNDYMFLQDGYGPYCSANLSVTKEIGKHVSLSFFANNFTNSRPTVYSMATGVGAIFTPSFYYGLTCRVKI